MAFDLSSIKRGPDIKPPRIAIHADSGVGKTTFAAGAPNAIVVQTEDGLGTLGVARFPLAQSYDDVLAALGTLYTQEHDFQTLVVDSLDWLEPLVWQHVVKVAGSDKIKSIEDFGYGKGYIEADKVWREFMRGITALRDTKNMAVVLIGHSQIVRVEDPLTSAYDSWQLKLHKRANAVIEEFVDIIAYAEVQTFVRTEDKGFNKKRAIANTSGARVMHTSPSPAFQAKNRYGLPPELPLTWAAFSEAFARAVDPQATPPAPPATTTTPNPF